MSEKKQFALNFVAQILFNMVNLAINFFLVPKIIYSINATAYGFISISTDFVNYIGLLTVALNSLAGRFIAINYHKKDYKKANTYFNSALFANLFIGILIAIGSIFFIVFLERIINIPSDMIFDVKLLFTLVIANFLVGMTASVFTTAAFIKNKLYLNSIVNIVTQVVRCVVLFSCYSFLPMNAWYMGLSALLCACIYNIANYVYFVKLTPELKINIKLFNLKNAIELTKSGLWNVLTRLSSTITNGLDLLIANLLVSSTAMGILALPRSIYSIILNLFSSLGGIFAPKTTMEAAKDNYAEMGEQMKFSYKFLGIISNTILVVFMIFGGYFFQLWVPTQDAKLLHLIATVSCVDLIFALPMEPFYNVHTSLNKIKIPALMLIIFSIVIITVEFIGLSMTDSLTMKLILISSTSSIIGIFRVLLFLPMYTAVLLKEKKTYFYPIIIKNSLAFIACIVVGLIFGQMVSVSGWLSFIIVCAVLAAVTLITTFYINFNGEERKRALRFITDRFKGKIKKITA